MSQGTAEFERPSRRGVFEALGAAILFGLTTPTVKSFAGTTSPVLVAGLLYFGSALGLLALLLVRRTFGARLVEAPLRAPDLPWLGGAILLGGIVGPILLVSGLASLPASAASLLLSLEAVFTIAIAGLVVREALTGRVAAGMALTLAGGMVLAWRGSQGFTTRSASLLVAGACLCWAIDNNLTRRISGSDPITIAALKCAVSGTVNIGLALAQGVAFPSAWEFGPVLVIGFVGYGLSLTLFVAALRHLGTARTGAYFAAAPFVGTIGSVLWLHEPVQAPLVVAGALMALGCLVLVSEQHAHLHAHARLEHSHRHRHDEHHRHVHAPGDPPGEPHAHPHVHEPMIHSHPHYPDLHHRHTHD